MKKYILLLAILFSAAFAWAQPTTAPNISSPSYGSTDTRAAVYTSWGNVSGATYYQVQYDTVSTFTSGYLFSDTFYLRTTELKDLLFGKRHYLRIRGVNSGGNGPWSSYHYFDVLALPDVLSFTTGGGFVASIVCTYHTGARLQYQFDTTPNFNSGALREVITTDPDSGCVPYRDLFFKQQYYFRARTFHSRDTTDWIATRIFTTLNGSYLETLNPNSLHHNFIWSEGYYYNITYPGVKYEFQLDTSPVYNSPLLIHKINDSLSFNDSLSNRYKMGSTWHARIRTITPVDTSEWEEVHLKIFSKPGILKPLGSLTQLVPLQIQPENHPGVDYFIYRLDTTFDLSSAYMKEDTLTNWKASPIKTLSIPYFGTHWVRMWAVAGDDTSEPANVAFTIPDNVTQVSPTNNITYTNAELSFSWQSVPNVSYQVQLDTEAGFGTIPARIHNVAAGKTDSLIGELSYGIKTYWRMRLVSAVDTGNWKTVRNFTVTPAPSLSWPSNFETSHTITADITCDALPGSEHYQFAVSKSPNFDTVYMDTARVDPNWGDVNLSLSHFPMQYTTQYYWKARAIHARDTSEWSQVWNFTTSPEMPRPPKAVLVKPANGSLDLPEDVTLEWELINDTFNAYYWLQYGTDPNFGPGTDSTLIIFIGNVNPTEKLEDLPLATTYYWRVKAVNDEKEGDWSDTWSFRTISPMLPPTPISPVNVSDQPLTVTLRWSKVPRATSYRYKIRDLPNLAAISPVTTTDTFVTVTLTKANTFYYWAVGARNATEQSSYSNTVSFSTGDPSSLLPLSDNGNLSVYPNPVGNTLYLMTVEEPVLSWQIIAVDGRVCSNGEGNFPEGLNVEGWPSGVYVLKVQTIEGHRTTRWVKE